MSQVTQIPTDDATMTLEAKLERARASWKARQDRALREAVEVVDPDTLVEADEPSAGPSVTPKPQTPASYRLCQSRKDEILRGERQGLYSCLPIAIGCEYPTLLTRLPVFRPSRRRTQNSALTSRGGFEFDSPWGRGVRKGPPMTVTDESVLMALLRLRSYHITGHGSELPLAIRNNEKGYQHVHYAVCTASQVIRELGLPRGGSQFKQVIDSVKDLAAMTIELEDRVRQRYLGSISSGSSIRLFSLRWDSFGDDSVFDIQFDPVMAHWLSKNRTFIDPVVRDALKGALAKALHRFLSSQGIFYENTLEKIARTVGFDGAPKNMRQKFNAALSELKRQGWLAHYEIRGSGRLDPLMVEVFRDETA